jgi:intracellular multiplication protein IcmL
MATEELQIVRLKDDFYRDGFQRVILAISIIAIAIGLLVAISAYLILSKPKPVIFPTDNEWRILSDVPVEIPYLSTADLLQWVTNVLKSGFTYDFINYSTQLSVQKKYFTDNGWTVFQNQINNYANANDVQKYKYFVSATPAGAPFVVNQGKLQGRYAWWVQMPITLGYSSNIKVSNTTLTIQVLVVRVPTLNNLFGVAVDNIIITK